MFINNDRYKFVDNSNDINQESVILKNRFDYRVPRKQIVCLYCGSDPCYMFILPTVFGGCSFAVKGISDLKYGLEHTLISRSTDS